MGAPRTAEGQKTLVDKPSPVSWQELEREKHTHSVLQFQFSEIKETLKQSEELLNVSICVKVCHSHIGAESGKQLLGTTLSPSACLFSQLYVSYAV